MIIIIMMFIIPLCISDTPYLLRSYPSTSTVTQSPFMNGPCSDPINTLSFLQGADVESINHTECVYTSNDLMLTCKLGLNVDESSLKLDDYPLDQINILILFVQEFPGRKNTSRVLDLCFINLLSQSLRELAICGYKPPITKPRERSDLHILDIPALAIVASKVETLLISSVNIWQSVELRQFRSLKNLLIIQGATIQMQYFHSPHCADCPDVHPQYAFSFHYLIPLSSQLTYFLYASYYQYDSCNYDILKKIQSSRSSIPIFIIASDAYSKDVDKPICDTCASGLCPLLSICLNGSSPDRRNIDAPFECLCVEELEVEDEFISCDSMTLHLPMYSTRCNHTPSFWNYVTLSMIILLSYILISILVFILSTIFLLKSN